MPVIFKYEISEAISELRKETYYHPQLRNKIIAAMHAGIEASTIIFEDTSGKDVVLIRSLEEFVGFLAAETGIVLHGIYNQEDLDKVCNLIRNRLVDRRTTVIEGSPSKSLIIH